MRADELTCAFAYSLMSESRISGLWGPSLPTSPMLPASRTIAVSIMPAVTACAMGCSSLSRYVRQVSPTRAAALRARRPRRRSSRLSSQLRALSPQAPAPSPTHRWHAWQRPSRSCRREPPLRGRSVGGGGGYRSRLVPRTLPRHATLPPPPLLPPPPPPVRLGRLCRRRCRTPRRGGAARACARRGRGGPCRGGGSSPHSRHRIAPCPLLLLQLTRPAPCTSPLAAASRCRRRDAEKVATAAALMA